MPMLKKIAEKIESVMTSDLTIDKPQRRVVCAAILYGDFIICGARHFDTPMHSVLAKIPEDVKGGGYREQGFIDQCGEFMSREEAFEVATIAGQIINKTGNPKSKQLFSAKIYINQASNPINQPKRSEDA